MRCPKCQYISFESANRCRNCGYDFSLAEDAGPPDLQIKSSSERIGAPGDLPLRAPSTRPEHAMRPDLPLFSGPADDAPLVTPSAVPRVPLSVRRGAPIITRPREQPSFGDEFAAEGEERLSGRVVAAGKSEPAAESVEEEGTGASPLNRVLAGIIDVSIMGGIDLAVIYLTLRIFDLELGDAMVLPKLPMLAFFLLLNGGYLVLFTAAGGQTIGKMATGIRVVPQSPEPAVRVPFSTAVLRAAAYLASLLPAGLGFLPIVFSADGRAVHDRLAHTRVVKA